MGLLSSSSVFLPGRDLAFIALTSAALVACFTLLRAMLLWSNLELVTDVPPADIVMAFAVGLRFDLIVASYIVAPLLIGLLLPQGLMARRWARLWIGLAVGVTVFAGIVELEFYREFSTRLNSIAFQYLREDTATVGSMIWHGFPVMRYVLAILVIVIVLLWLVQGLHRLTALPGSGRPGSSGGVRLAVFMVALLMVVAGARGTLRSGPPLRWGDAYHSEHTFANHLALNGSYTLVKALTAEGQKKSSERWRDQLDDESAREITRDMLLTTGDQLLSADTYPVLRRSTPAGQFDRDAIDNVVVIIMESFGAAFIGTFGDMGEVTPEFDKLVEEGLLFERFFANGTHTHQGMFASLACFPNLPGYEYLMQTPEGTYQFAGLPELMAGRGLRDVYVYNGDFAWDNQQGFFQNQGMTRFVGRNDFDSPGFVDPTWGVSDIDLFTRAAVELRNLEKQGPFYAVIQTLSNHVPFSLPDPLPVTRVTDRGEYSEHLTAMRYSDWALGVFFREIRQHPLYEKTLFVIIGDHGFGRSQNPGDIDLHRHHVPMLLIAPGLRETYGARNNRVASQVDVVPTIMGLLGEPYTQQCWGRDILALPAGDPGFAVIKPSGSDPTVALISGDRMLVSPEDRPVQIGHYSGAPDFIWRPFVDDTARQQLFTQLQAYVQTALEALESATVGLPEEHQPLLENKKNP